MASSPPRPRPRRPAAAASSTTSSSSVVALTAEDLLDTAASAAADNSTRWPEASGTRSTLALKPRHSVRYHIPEQYTLVSACSHAAARGWAACDAPPEGYNMVCAYAAAFRAGMRLPLHGLHAAVLRHYGLAPAQLMPNAWRYLNAFVLLCEDAAGGVPPALPVFLFFFVLCAEKESAGRYHFRPRRCPLPPLTDSGPGSDGRHCRLFTGKMPHSAWKHRFFFIQAPSWMPWPCPLRWGAPSKASVKEPVLLNNGAPESEAIQKLLRLAGDTGIDILKFLSVRNPPVGQLQQNPAPVTPQRVAVKQEANAATVADTAAADAGSEQTRKRKSPEPITSLGSLQILPDFPTPALAGVALGHGEPRVTGGERSCFRKRLHFFAQEASAEFEAKEEELQMAKIQHEEDVAQLKQALVAAKDQHEAELKQALVAAKDQQEAELKQALVAAKVQHEAELKQALVAAKVQHEAELKLALVAAKDQQEAELKQALVAAKARHEAELKQALVAAKAQHDAEHKQALVAAKAQHEAKLKQALEAANTKHATDLAKANDKASGYAEELQKANDKYNRFVEDLQKAQADHMAKLLQITGMHCHERIKLQQESSRAGVAPQPPQDDQN